MEHKVIITPKTKLAELLDAYPELEKVLIDIAPAFKKLKNPILRRTIARVTSLQHAALVGEIPVGMIVNKLRGIVGQDELIDMSSASNYTADLPSWFVRNEITKTFDAREVIAQGGHPLGDVMGDLHQWKVGGIYELITSFMPAPLIDKVRKIGFESWTKKENEVLYRNYFFKKPL
ncbi:MAG: DUF1858 domain-containing protein [Bacteroidales bacterium]|nr:DUF1858 domain-containing protein [Bacteroidales bacterium]